MNVERTLDRRQRAAIHAALSDPARLAIVDTLIVGDASPSELAAHLGMPSNLLAHHLKVLEGERIVYRTRSEADRRRTYLHLVPGALDGLLPVPDRSTCRVLFVCTANSARSVLAASLWKRRSQVPAASAGTHPADRFDPGALAAAKRHRLALRNGRPRDLREVLADGDLVVTVCDSAHEELGSQADLHWSVPDPVCRGTDDAFDAALDELTRRVDGLAPHLTARAGGPSTSD